MNSHWFQVIHVGKVSNNIGENTQQDWCNNSDSTDCSTSSVTCCGNVNAATDSARCERHLYVANHIKWYYSPEHSSELLTGLYPFAKFDQWAAKMRSELPVLTVNDRR